jgi:hypothetical protein
MSALSSCSSCDQEGGSCFPVLCHPEILADGTVRDSSGCGSSCPSPSFLSFLPRLHGSAETCVTFGAHALPCVVSTGRGPPRPSTGTDATSRALSSCERNFLPGRSVTSWSPASHWLLGANNFPVRFCPCHRQVIWT